MTNLLPKRYNHGRLIRVHAGEAGGKWSVLLAAGCFINCAGRLVYNAAAADAAVAGFLQAYHLNEEENKLLDRIAAIVGGFSAGAGLRISVTGMSQDLAGCSVSLFVTPCLGFWCLCSHGGSNEVMSTVLCLWPSPPCAGHSLGGTLAVLAAQDLARSYPLAEMTVCTFGAPKVRCEGVARQPPQHLKASQVSTSAPT